MSEAPTATPVNITLQAETPAPVEQLPKQKFTEQKTEKSKKLWGKVQNWLPFWRKEVKAEPQKVVEDIAEVAELPEKPEKEIVLTGTAQTETWADSNLKESQSNHVNELSVNQKEKKYPTYINETVTRIEASSQVAYEQFVSGENINHRTQRALKETLQMKQLLEQLPDKKNEILSVMPSKEDWKRSKVKPGDWTAILRQTPKEATRRKLLEEAFWGDWTGQQKKKFDEIVKSEAKQQAAKIISKAQKEAENNTKEGNVLIISARAETVMSLFSEDQYVPLLDTNNIGFSSFSEVTRQEIQTRLKLFRKSKKYESKSGLSPIERRYLREIELGVYPPDGESQKIRHPVYGQIVVNEAVELARAEQEGYGEIHLKLKTDKIKDRTSFVVGDSLNDASIFNQQLAWNEATKARTFLNSIAESSGVDWRLLPSYIEAHIMGGVASADIEGCLFTPGDTTKSLEIYFQQNPDRFKISQREDGQMWAKFL